MHIFAGNGIFFKTRWKSRRLIDQYVHFRFRMLVIIAMKQLILLYDVCEKICA